MPSLTAQSPEITQIEQALKELEKAITRLAQAGSQVNLRSLLGRAQELGQAAGIPSSVRSVLEAASGSVGQLERVKEGGVKHLSFKVSTSLREVKEVVGGADYKGAMYWPQEDEEALKRLANRFLGISQENGLPRGVTDAMAQVGEEIKRAMEIVKLQIQKVQNAERDLRAKQKEIREGEGEPKINGAEEPTPTEPGPEASKEEVPEAKEMSPAEARKNRWMGNLDKEAKFAAATGPVTAPEIVTPRPVIAEKPAVTKTRTM